MDKIKILIVDDHPAMRHGIAQLIEMDPDFEVCAEAGNADEVFSLSKDKHPNFVLLDISLNSKEINGLDLIPEIKKHFGDVPILIYSMHDEALYAERSLKAGAKGYLMKQEPISVLIQAIRKVFSGDIYLSEEQKRLFIEKLIRGNDEELNKSPDKCLTDRELEIFKLIGKGMQPAEIARKLFLSVKTVETHRFMIRKKMGFGKASELIHFAIEWVHSNR